MFEWLPIRPEILLFLVAAGLYLIDLAQRMFANEALFVREPNGRWSARLSDKYPEFGRRYVALPRPWQPHAIVVRAAWPRSSPVGEKQELKSAIEDSLENLRVVRFLSAPLIWMIFAALPGLYFIFGAKPFLVGVALVYAQTLLMLGWLAYRRRTIGLAPLSLAQLTFESLVCIPYAINVYRKVFAQAIPGNVDAADLADAFLDEDRKKGFMSDLLASVQRTIDLDDGDNAVIEQLQTYRRRLTERFCP